MYCFCSKEEWNPFVAYDLLFLFTKSRNVCKEIVMIEQLVAVYATWLMNYCYIARDINQEESLVH